MNTKQKSIFDTDEMKNKGYYCPCCSSFVKEYKRTLNSNMARALIVLYRFSMGKFSHLEKLIKDKGYERCGDASYLVHYGLIDRLKEDRVDGSSRNGYYRITMEGIMFVEGKSKQSKYFRMFNGTLKGFEGEQINIKDALGNKFDYKKLMQE